MGDSKVSRSELAEFARQTAEFLEPIQRRQHALEVCFDVLVTSLGKDVEAKVKAELERRAAAVKNAATKSDVG